MQFGIIITFSSVFPLASLICLLQNFFKVFFVRNEIKYNKRLFPQISIGIGQFMYMIDFMSHLSIVVNTGIVYFTSQTFRNLFISKEIEKVCIGMSTTLCMYSGKTDKLFIDTTGFLLAVIAVEHTTIMIKFLFTKYMENE
jgi:hypothetical protein